MKKEKNMLQDKFSAGEYLAPVIKVKELKSRRVLCASDGGTTNMTFGNELKDEGFE